MICMRRRGVRYQQWILGSEVSGVDVWEESKAVIPMIVCDGVHTSV